MPAFFLLRHALATTALLAFIRETAAAPDVSSAPWSPLAAEGWRPLPLGELYVRPGSALDFSSLVEAGPAGRHGQAIINDEGRIVFEKQPDRPLRLFTCGEGMEYWQPETDDEIAAYALQVRLAGYNCFRPHFLDHMLMIGAAGDLQPSPKQLARWDRLVAELKKQGVYLYIDINTSWTAFYATPSREANWTAELQARRLKTRLYYEPEAREHWEKSMRLLLERVNPHTGTALKNDPQVIFLQLRNEAGLHFQFEHGNPGGVLERDFLPLFQRWLEKRYGTIERLNSVWSGATAHASFAEIAFPLLKGLDAPAIDFQRFIVDSEVDTFRWLKAATERIGTRAIIFDYNVGVQFGHNLSRSAGPVVDSHAYHDHPTAYISPGSSQPNQSSAASLLDYFVWLNESRQIDRPFIVSEWGFPYWNQWRHEAGVGLPAYAALQGWQMLAHHAEPIRPAVDIPLRPFKIAYDPAGKASERMAALFYARGDVAPARHTVELRQDPEGTFTRWGGEGHFTSALRKLSLLTGFGLRVIDFSPAAPGGSKIKTDASLALHPTKRAVQWVDRPDAPTDTADELVARLREIGVLSPDNRTDPAADVYQSDTRQLLVDARNKLIQVDTPRSQGASVPEGSAPVALSALRIKNTGPSAAFFVGSLDGADLPESKRVLLIAVGDAVNTGAVFTDAKRRELRELGELPVLTRPLRFALHLRRASSSGPAPRLWALTFNGDRLKQLPVKALAGGWLIEIDAAQDPELGIYYELEAGSR